MPASSLWFFLLCILYPMWFPMKALSNFSVITASAALLLLGCASIVHPPGELMEQVRALELKPPGNEIAVPELTKDAPVREVLYYGFARSPILRAAFNDWVAALERVPQAGALPDPQINLSLDAQYLLGFDPFRRLGLQGARRVEMEPDGGDMVRSSTREQDGGGGKLLDALGFGFSQEVPGSGKRAARADEALAGAKATGLRFLATERELRRDILKAYAELLLNRRRAEVEQENIRLLREIEKISLTNLSAGTGNEADVLKSEIAVTEAETELRAVQIEEPRLAGVLNALIARNAEQPIGKLSSVRTDWDTKEADELLRIAVWYNPELAALRADVEKQDVSIVLARLERNPDFRFGTNINTMQQMLMAGLSLPINSERIEAQIREAQASSAAAQNRHSAAVFEAMAGLVGSLSSIKDSERILNDYGKRLVPQLRELVSVQVGIYGTGTGASFLDILDTRRSFIQAERLIIQADSERLKAMAELESIAGANLLTLASTSFDLIKPVDLDAVAESTSSGFINRLNVEIKTENAMTTTPLDGGTTTSTLPVWVLPPLNNAPTRKPDSSTTVVPTLLRLPALPADSGTTIGAVFKSRQIYAGLSPVP